MYANNGAAVAVADGGGGGVDVDVDVDIPAPFSSAASSGGNHPAKDLPVEGYTGRRGKGFSEVLVKIDREKQTSGHHRSLPWTVQCLKIHTTSS